MTDKVKIGDTLWYVPYRRYTNAVPSYVVVNKVGRKWAEAGGLRGRFDAVTLDHDFGVLWRSREECEEHEKADAAWAQLHKFVSAQYRRPRHLDEMAVRMAMAYLGAE